MMRQAGGGVLSGVLAAPRVGVAEPRASFPFFFARAVLAHHQPTQPFDMRITLFFDPRLTPFSWTILSRQERERPPLSRSPFGKTQSERERQTPPVFKLPLSKTRRFSIRAWSA